MYSMGNAGINDSLMSQSTINESEKVETLDSGGQYRINRDWRSAIDDGDL